MKESKNYKILCAILHILDNSVQIPIISSKEIDLTEYINSYIEGHLDKVINSDNIKKGVINKNGEYRVCNLLGKLNESNFIDISAELANYLFDIMKKNPNIPPADVVFSIFTDESNKYLALMKFNYKLSYIHYVSNSQHGTVNSLIRQTTTLPGNNQRLDECVIINLSTNEVSLIEKAYEINDVKGFYLSNEFLRCSFDLSKNEKFKILNKTVKKLNKKHFDDNFEKKAEFNNALVESLKDKDFIETNSVIGEIYKDNSEIQHEYFNELNKEGLKDNTSIQLPKRVIKKLQTQKLTTDNGIEINLPIEHYTNKDLVEFINNPDGTISILLKNVNKITN